MALALAAACSREPAPAPSPDALVEGACPAGSREDEQRRAAIVALLNSVPEGAALVDRATGQSEPVGKARALPIHLCFSKHAPSGLTPGGVALLDDELSLPEAAARVGHLLLHQLEGLPFTGDPHAEVGAGTGTDTGTDCHARVERAVTAEARAFDLEFRLRGALGVQNPRLVPELESTYWRAPPEARLATIATYLRDHPDGAPGMEAIVGGYLRRCQSAPGR